MGNNINSESNPKVQNQGELESSGTLMSKSGPQAGENLGNKVSPVIELYSLGEFHLKQGNYPEALECIKQGIELAEKMHGSGDLKVGEGYIRLGIVGIYENQNEAAQESIKKGLDIISAKVGKHPDLAEAYQKIGSAYYQCDRLDEAIKAYNNGLEIITATLGTGHPRTAKFYIYIAEVYGEKGLNDEAIHYYKKGLKLASDLPDDETAKIYDFIASRYLEKDCFAEASYYYDKEMELKIKKLGRTHPSIAAFADLVAMSFFTREATFYSIVYYRKELDVLTALPGKDIDIAEVYSKIGHAYKLKQMYKDAIGCYLKEARIRQNRAPAERNPLMAVYKNLGSSFFSLKLYDQAIEYHLKREDLLIPMKNHFEAAEVYLDIGDAYLAKGIYEKAIEYYNRAMTKISTIGGQDSFEMSMVYDKLGTAQLVKGNFGEALKCLKEELDIKTKRLAQNDPSIANTHARFGYYYLKSGAYDDAISCFTQVLNLKQGKEVDPFHLIQDYINLGNAYKGKRDFHNTFASYSSALTLIHKLKEIPVELLVTMKNLFFSAMHSATDTKGDELFARFTTNYVSKTVTVATSLLEELSLKNLPMDASSMFHCISYALLKDDYLATDPDKRNEFAYSVRKLAAEIIRRNAEAFYPSDFNGDLIENYTRALEKPGFWGRDTELKAFALYFRVHIVLYVMTKTKVLLPEIFTGGFPSTKKMILLMDVRDGRRICKLFVSSHQGEVHESSLFPNDEAEIQTLAEKFFNKLL